MEEKFYDCLGNEINIGSAVCGISAGNFIYGHITEINEKKVTMTPDIGYRSSKPNFRLKNEYKIGFKNVALITDNNK